MNEQIKRRFIGWPPRLGPGLLVVTLTFSLLETAGVVQAAYCAFLQEPSSEGGQEKDRAAAQKLLTEADQLRQQGTAESLRMALAKYEAALPLWRAAGDQRGEAETLTTAGMAYHNLSQPKKALEYYNRALAMWRSLGDKFWEARTLSAIGWTHQSLGENQTALDCYNKALAIRKAIGDRNGQAQTLGTIAAIYSSSGDLAKALDHYSQALAAIGEAGDRLVRAYILNSIAYVYNGVGEVQTALDYIHQVLPLWKAAGNKLGEAEALNAMGQIYGGLHQEQTALGYYEEALSLYRAAGNRYGEAQALNNMGIAHWNLGESQKALNFYDRALAIWQEMSNRSQQSRVLGNIGLAHFRSGEFLKALDYLGRAQSIDGESGNRRGDASILGNIGLTYEALGDSQKAGDYYGRALQLYRTLRDRKGEAHVLVNLSRVERERGNLAEARSDLEAALAILEPLRTKVISPELRASYFASVYYGKYEVYTDLLMQLHKRQPLEGHDAAALEASERARARTLLEMLTEAGADIRQGVDLLLLEQERHLQRQLNAKAEYQTRLLGSKHTQEQAAAVEKEIESLTREYQEVEAQIRARSPRYAALTQPRTLNLKEIQQQVLDPDTLLLEFSLGTERSYLWAVSPNSISSHELPARTEIETAARRVYGLLSARQTQPGDTDQKYRARVARADAEFPAAAASLSQTLLSPVASQLGTKRLLIVAEGALQYVPFAALPTPVPNRQLSDGAGKASHDERLAPANSRLLIAQHEVVSVPSASVLVALRRETAGRKSPDKTVAVLADPVFDKGDDRVAGANRRAGKEATDQVAMAGGVRPHGDVQRAVREVGVGGQMGIPRLPFSRDEAEGILAVAPADKSLKAIAFRASRATATDPALAQYRILHFATHALLNNEHPELSGIVLSLVDEQGRPQDGFLRLHELYNLDLPVELVVLSACQTGLGKEIKGEGLVGLVRGFMYAGSPRVVASQWKVDDWATAELMKHFYQAMLKNNMRPAAALRAAQLAMWKEKRWQAPYYWAGFVLHGEWK